MRYKEVYIRSPARYFSSKEVKTTLKSNRMKMYFRNYCLSPLHFSKRQFTYGDGASYNGQWVGGFRYGLGVQTWPDGASYSGSWVLGRPYGEGIFIHPDGDTYEGKWVSPFISIVDNILETSNINGYAWLLMKQQVSAVSRKSSSLKKYPTASISESVIEIDPETELLADYAE
jgi:hypothetical protein